MPETSPARRRLRAALASAVRYGDHDRANRARTALSVEQAVELLDALTEVPAPINPAQATRLRVAVRDAIRRGGEQR